MTQKIKAIKKQFTQLEWYKQGGAFGILTGSVPWKSVLDLTVNGNPVSFNYVPFAVGFFNNFFDIYFSRKGTRRIASFYIQQEIKKKGFIAALHKNWLARYASALLKSIHKVESTKLSLLDNRALLNFFSEFVRVNVSFWRESIFLDSFDVESEGILEDAVKKEKNKLNDSQIRTLTAPTQLSWSQKERKGLIAIAERIDAQFLTFHEARTSLEAHAQKYHWILNDYVVIQNLDWKFFLKHIKELLKDKNKMMMEKSAIEDVKKAIRRKTALIKKLHISSNLIRVTDFLVVLARWRDDRKAFNQMANATLYLFGKEFAARTKMSIKDVEHLLWWEVKGSFKTTKKTRALAKKRREGFFSVNDPLQSKNIFYGKEGIDLQNFMINLLAPKKDLTGRAAFPGIVKGRVKIVKTQKDFFKMKKGDILVAPNTRPEYVPIMKIAGAIISEEGGITCHTAIVARELKIPAIIGMQGAVTALKDGDLIEVDAGAGKVKRV